MRASWMRSISRWAAGDSGVRARNSTQGRAGSRATSRSSPNVCLLKNTAGLSAAKSCWSTHCAVSARRVDAQRRQEPAGLRAVRRRRRDCVRAAVAKQQLSAGAELVARRVTAEVVVVVEEQDAGVVAGLLAEEVRSSEPTDAAAYHDQIVRLTRVSDSADLLPERAVSQRVR